MAEFRRYDWEEYKEYLINLGYSDDEISAVKEIRENPEIEKMTSEQFRYLFLAGIIKRTRKLRKPRTLFVIDDKVWYLEHYNRKFCYCGYFKTEGE